MFHLTKTILEEFYSHPKVATWYLQYLQSAHWLNFRKLIMKQRGKKCQICGTRMWKNLILHHLTYERLGHELTSDVLLVDKKCHRGYCHNHRIIPFSERIYDENYKIT